MRLRTQAWLLALEFLRHGLQPLLVSAGTVSGLAVVVGFVGLLPDIQRASETWPASARDCCFFEQGNLAIAACHAAPLHPTQGWRYFLAHSQRGSVARVSTAWSDLSPSCIAPGPGTNIFVGCWDGGIYSIDTLTPEAPPQRIVRDATVIPDLLACSSDGILLAVGYKQITAWDIRAKSALWTRSLIASCIAIHAGGQKAVCGTGGELLELDLQSGLTRRSATFGSDLVALRFSPNGQFLAVVELQGQFTVLHWPTLSPAWDGEPRPCGAGSFVAFSPDGRLLATNALGSRSIAVWDAAAGTLKSQCSEGLSPIVGARFVDDCHLVSWAFDGVLRFWDVSRGALEREVALTNLEPAP